MFKLRAKIEFMKDLLVFAVIIGAGLWFLYKKPTETTTEKEETDNKPTLKIRKRNA
jgi:hypothetical protein